MMYMFHGDMDSKHLPVQMHYTGLYGHYISTISTQSKL